MVTNMDLGRYIITTLQVFVYFMVSLKKVKAFGSISDVGRTKKGRASSQNCCKDR